MTANPRFSLGRTCKGCTKPINNRAVTGMCKSCFSKSLHADPEFKARHKAATKRACGTDEARSQRSAAIKKAWANPESRAVMVEARRRAMADPVKRAAVGTAGAANLRKFHETRSFDWRAFHRARCAKQREWCPAELRDEYRRLRRDLGAAEARRIILADIAAAERRRLAAMDPLERQMEQLAKGAKLVPAFNPKRADYAFTLGGIAPEAL